MNYIKFTLIFFSSLWMIGAAAVALDKAQRFNHRQREGKL